MRRVEEQTEGHITFGQYIMNRRLELKLSQRYTAKLLDVSIQFYSDVEKGRRCSMSLEHLEKLAKVLQLEQCEKYYMYDLVGYESSRRISPDLPEYIMENDYVREAIRQARDAGVGEEVWREFAAKLKN